MKYKKSFSLHFYLLTLCCCFGVNKGKSQDTSTLKPITYYRVTIGGGLGKGYPQSESEIGIGGCFRAAIQRNKTLYTLGTTGLGEIEIFDNSNINENISSVEFMYGRILSSDMFFCSISGGVGIINSQEKGTFISREGGWLFGYNTYEKIKRSSIGIPISFQTFWIPTKFYGIGLDFYANINSINSFYTVSLCHQFGKLKPPSKRKNNINTRKLTSSLQTL